MLQVYSANKNLPPDHKPSNNCGDFIHMLCPRVQDVLDTGEKHFWKRSDIGLRDWKVSRTWSALSICEQRQQPEQWLLSAEVIGFQDSLFKDSVSDSVEQTKVQDFKTKRSRQSHTHTRAHTHTHPWDTLPNDRSQTTLVLELHSQDVLDGNGIEAQSICRSDIFWLCRNTAIRTLIEGNLAFLALNNYLWTCPSS